MDRRSTILNAYVAEASLKGQVEAASFSDGTLARVGPTVCNLLSGPSGARDRQLLPGASVRIYDTRDGFSYVKAEADGYVGYVLEDKLDANWHATHFVSTRATHAYEKADLKSWEQTRLTYGSQVQVLDFKAAFAETPWGFIPKGHLTKLSERSADPIETAKLFLGTPYLWGGNSDLGIDCSGLVQVALHSANFPCPGDSDQQMAALGDTLPEGAKAEAGDFFFWKGHVAMAVSPTELIHANGTHMAVVLENIEDAIARIKAAGDGPVLRHARLS